MTGWLTPIFGVEYAPIANVVVLLLLLLLVALAALWLRRRLGHGGGLFAHGGRDRKHRLGVLEHVAVDQRRRLILVRRDDVEHLILIGGPTDVVVESGVEPRQRSAPPVRSPALPETRAPVEQAPPPRALEQPAPSSGSVPLAAAAAAQQLPRETEAAQSEPRRPLPGTPQPAPAAAPEPVAARMEPPAAPSVRPEPELPKPPHPSPIPGSAAAPAAQPAEPALAASLLERENPAPRTDPPLETPDAEAHGAAHAIETVRDMPQWPDRADTEPQLRSEPEVVAAATVSEPQPAPAQTTHEIDADLLQELQQTLHRQAAEAVSQKGGDPHDDNSLDREMSKLLAGLSKER